VRRGSDEGQSLPASAASVEEASVEELSLEEASLAPESLDAESVTAASCDAASAASEVLASCAPLSAVLLDADASAEGGCTTLSSPLHPAMQANDANASG